MSVVSPPVRDFGRCEVLEGAAYLPGTFMSCLGAACSVALAVWPGMGNSRHLLLAWLVFTHRCWLDAGRWHLEPLHAECPRPSVWRTRQVPWFLGSSWSGCRLRGWDHRLKGSGEVTDSRTINDTRKGVGARALCCRWRQDAKVPAEPKWLHRIRTFATCPV